MCILSSYCEMTFLARPLFRRFRKPYMPFVFLKLVTTVWMLCAVHHRKRDSYTAALLWNTVVFKGASPPIGLPFVFSLFGDSVQLTGLSLLTRVSSEFYCLQKRHVVLRNSSTRKQFCSGSLWFGHLPQSPQVESRKRTGPCFSEAGPLALQGRSFSDFQFLND